MSVMPHAYGARCSCAFGCTGRGLPSSGACLISLVHGLGLGFGGIMAETHRSRGSRGGGPELSDLISFRSGVSSQNLKSTSRTIWRTNALLSMLGPVVWTDCCPLSFMKRAQGCMRCDSKQCPTQHQLKPSEATRSHHNITPTAPKTIQRLAAWEVQYIFQTIDGGSEGQVST
jgi:hypothetical protein